MAEHPIPNGDDIILPDGTVVGSWNGDDVKDLQVEGIDYDEAIDTFYDDVNEIQSSRLAECVMEVDDINSE